MTRTHIPNRSLVAWIVLEMLSFFLSFGQTDRKTDRQTLVKQYAADLSMWGHKMGHNTEIKKKMHFELYP